MASTPESKQATAIVEMNRKGDFRGQKASDVAASLAQSRRKTATRSCIRLNFFGCFFPLSEDWKFQTDTRPTAKPSRDVVVAGHQQSTQEWWEYRRQDFRVVASQLVLQEAGGGDVQVAQRRLDILQGVELLEITPNATALAHALVEHAAIPKTSLEDALHVAVAVVSRCTYLMTWNYRHLAGAGARARIEAFCRDKGYEPAIICTPEELLEDEP